MRIYVGNLGAETSEDELRAMFTPHGRVATARLAKDKVTGEPRGFGIVVMEDEPGRTAIAALQGARSSGRKLRVKEAKPRLFKPENGGAPTPTPAPTPAQASASASAPIPSPTPAQAPIPAPTPAQAPAPAAIPEGPSETSASLRRESARPGDDEAHEEAGRVALHAAMNEARLDREIERARRMDPRHGEPQSRKNVDPRELSIGDLLTTDLAGGCPGVRDEPRTEPAREGIPDAFPRIPESKDDRVG